MAAGHAGDAVGLDQAMTATVHGVGTGPGDPELLTAKAIRVIGAADAVFFIEADGKLSRALKIAEAHLRPEASLCPIAMPMRADPSAGTAAYDKAADEIATRAGAGESVAVLCEGDPLLYGSFIYLLERLQERLPVEIVPGIPSFLAGAAALRRGLVRRTDRLSLLPATLDEAHLTAALRVTDCAAILKTGGHLAKVRQALTDAAFPDAFVINEASGESQTVTPLSAVTENALPYFSIVMAWREHSE